MLVVGAIPTALLFLAVFPPDFGLGQAGLFCWLLLVSITLRTFLTIYYIPFTAMGAELSPDYDERTVIAKARVTVGWLSGISVTAIAYILIFQKVGETDGRLVADNYMTYGILSAVLTIVTALICILGTRTVIPRLPQSGQSDPSFSLRRILADMQSAWANKNFRYMFAATLAFGMSSGVYATMSLYLGTYFWEFSSEQMAGLVVPAVIAAILCFMAMHRLGQHFDKAQLLGAASIGMAVNMLWMIGARVLEILPPNGDALIYPMMLLTALAGVCCIIVTQTFGVSLLADILDEQELASGVRQEGVFFAANAFALKATTGIGLLVAGVIIDLSGVTTGSEPGTIPTNVLNALGSFTAGGIFLFCVVAFLFFRRIDLGRKNHQRVQEQLADLKSGRAEQ
jgi:GPH family glycoside/pentoside/hexuronide:cation symporter